MPGHLSPSSAHSSSWCSHDWEFSEMSKNRRKTTFKVTKYALPSRRARSYKSEISPDSFSDHRLRRKLQCKLAEPGRLDFCQNLFPVSYLHSSSFQSILHLSSFLPTLSPGKGREIPNHHQVSHALSLSLHSAPSTLHFPASLSACSQLPPWLQNAGGTLGWVILVSSPSLNDSMISHSRLQVGTACS